MPLALTHLAYDPDGAETAPPLLIAHGLFGQARNFHSLSRRLATDRRVVAVDMRNHGSSPWAAEMDYRLMGEDLAEAVVRLCGGRAVVLGHSMGGKAAMALALTAPDLLAGLVVVDIAPVAYRHSHESFVAAMRGVDLARVTRRSEADPMLAAAIPEAPLRAFILQNLEISEGRARWRLNLDALAANMAHLLGFPEAFPHAPHDGPSYFLHGGASDYVAPKTHARIRTLFPEAEIEAVPGAGHWLHAEKPDVFVVKVRGWLDTL